jgi:hypothetical protein
MGDTHATMVGTKGRELHNFVNCQNKSVKPVVDGITPSLNSTLELQLFLSFPKALIVEPKFLLLSFSIQCRTFR